MEEEVDERILHLLSSLIAHKNRADAKGWRDAFENMPVYLQRVELESDVNTLPVIHVAGTKGKGSTCAMLESMLRQCGYRTGLFTSPHLVDVRERVRINGCMVDKSVFESHFWWCYERFNSLATPEVGVPGYFRFLTLLALKIFVHQHVDVVVLEVGIGGRLDATNIIPAPVVCGITALGMDHMDMLGDTLPKIAGEKAGILKPGVPGLTVQQPEDAMEVIREAARHVQAPLQVVPPLDDLQPEDGPGPIPVGLGGEHQRMNAALAVQLCSKFEERRLASGNAAPGAGSRLELLRQGKLPAQYGQGLRDTSWLGRST
ncbi:folylpolyglutamate synthetase, partial [Dunaliella salina]